MSVQAYCWNWIDNHKVKFRFNPGFYKNFIEFLQISSLEFFSTLELDFSTIPSEFRGKGHSKNLIQYLKNNSENIDLIISFLRYFVSEIMNVNLSDNTKKFTYGFNKAARWQDITFVNSIAISLTTTTTTYSILIDTTETPTTTEAPTTTTTTLAPTTTTTEAPTTTTTTLSPTTTAPTTTTTTTPASTTTTTTTPATTTTTTTTAATTTTTLAPTTTTTLAPTTTTTTTIASTTTTTMAIETLFIYIE